MNELPGAFLLRLLTQCGIPLLAGGFCRAGFEEQSCRDISALSRIEFRESDDAYDIDFRIAEVIRNNCGSYVWAAGVSAALPDTGKYRNAKHRTGGVIGSPHLSPGSAGGGVESIGHGFYVRAFPGGPGCVAFCDDGSALESFSPDDRPGVVKIGLLSEKLRRHGIKTFFIVSDGTGPETGASFFMEIDGKVTALYR